MIIKTEKEREILREGGERLATVLNEVSKICLVGTKLIELDEYAKKLIKEYGDTPSFLGYGAPPFPGALCISVNDGIVHGIPDGYELKEGDLLKLDGGIWHEGLCTDSAITVGIGEISNKDKELASATLEALEAQVEVAITGNTIGDIGAAAEEVAKRYNLGFPKELGGHGVGLEVHEKPFVFNYGKRGTGEELKKDMVIAYGHCS